MPKARLGQHPFEYSHYLPLDIRANRGEPAIRPKERMEIIQLKPLHGDFIVRGALGMPPRITSRENERAVVFIDTNMKPHMVFPDLLPRGFPYSISVAFPAGSKVRKGYWLATLPIDQDAGPSFNVQLHTHLGRPDPVEIEVEAVKYFHSLPSSNQNAARADVLHFDTVLTNAIRHLLPHHKRSELPPKGATRYDLRDRLIYTIDGPSTKDIDDAIEIVELEHNSRFLLGVHIADVTEYVAGESPIDLEARRRGTSHYLADRVIHMLPDELASNYCSLNANEDKLAFSAYILFRVKEGYLIVEDSQIFRSVIRSKHRLTYAAVNEILNRAPNPADALDTSLRFAHQLATLLTEKHSEYPDNIKYSLRGGRVVREQREIGDSDNLIEQLMVVTNRKAGEIMAGALSATGDKGVAAFRVQASPRTAEVESFYNKLVRHGLLKGYNLGARQAHFVAESKSARGANFTQAEQERWVTTLLFNEIRAAVSANHGAASQLRAAVLEFKSPPSIGRMLSPAGLEEGISNTYHHSMGIHRYAWFTSPIRRYPDVVNHRWIKQILGGAPRPPVVDVSKLAAVIGNQKHAGKAINSRLLLRYLADQENIHEMKDLSLVPTFFRYIYPQQLMIEVLWQWCQQAHRFNLVFRDVTNRQALIYDDGLSCNLSRPASSFVLRIGTPFRLRMRPGGGTSEVHVDLARVTAHLSDVFEAVVHI